MTGCVCRPEELGGLGITDPQESRSGTRVRWVWKDRTSGRAPASGERVVIALFQEATMHHLGNGRSTFFWTDRWLIWSPSLDERYSAASAYSAIFLGSSPVFGAKDVWKTAAPPRVWFFFWLATHNRCSTGARCFRHGLQDSDLCIFCDQECETLDHILMGCCYSHEV